MEFSAFRRSRPYNKNLDASVPHEAKAAPITDQSQAQPDVGVEHNPEARTAPTNISAERTTCQNHGE